jgi:hypothetical protein
MLHLSRSKLRGIKPDFRIRKAGACPCLSYLYAYLFAPACVEFTWALPLSFKKRVGVAKNAAPRLGSFAQRNSTYRRFDQGAAFEARGSSVEKGFYGAGWGGLKTSVFSPPRSFLNLCAPPSRAFDRILSPASLLTGALFHDIPSIALKYVYA